MRTVGMTELPLVVGVDGSQSSFTAVDWAADEAMRRNAPVRLVYASRWERYEGVKPAFGIEKSTAELLGDRVTAAAADRVRRRAPDLAVSADALVEDPVRALVRVGREAFALVLGARGAGPVAEMLLGSVSLAVAGRADCPVVVVRGEERNRSGGFGRIVVGLGHPRADSDVVRFAFQEAAVRGAELHAVRAWRVPAIDIIDEPLRHADTSGERRRQAERELAEALREPEDELPEVVVRRETVEGHPHSALLEAARTADLLVVGAHRQAVHHGLQLGRVAHALLHYAPCPVAIVPHRA